MIFTKFLYIATQNINIYISLHKRYLFFNPIFHTDIISIKSSYKFIVFINYYF